jgi:hypothetical protein
MAYVSTIVTVQTDATRLVDVADWVDLATRLGVGADTELLDGGHVHLVGDTRLGRVDSVGGTVGAVRTWVAAAREAGWPDDSAVAHGADLAVDASVTNVIAGDCGEHVGVLPPILVVYTDPVCGDHTPNVHAAPSD